MSKRTKQEIFDAVVARLLELGYGPGRQGETIPERARIMIDEWEWFSDNSVDERGHETCRDWIDPELVRLFDEHLHVAYGVPFVPFGDEKTAKQENQQ
jgi:hypothetical protein